jgi:hypothetical protein
MCYIFLAEIIDLLSLNLESFECSSVQYYEDDIDHKATESDFVVVQIPLFSWQRIYAC